MNDHNPYFRQHFKKAYRQNQDFFVNQSLASIQLPANRDDDGVCLLIIIKNLVEMNFNNFFRNSSIFSSIMDQLVDRRVRVFLFFCVMETFKDSTSENES